MDPGLSGASDRPVPGIDNGFVAGYRVRFDEAGPDGRIRTSALLRYAQDVAWRHSEALGFDRQWYVDRGLWWVVRAVDLEVIGPVGMGQTIRVSTAVTGHRRIWARRVADARDASGTLTARIVTDWVMLDVRGRLVRIPEDFGLSFTNPQLSAEIVRVELPAERQHGSEIRFAVRPHDLDPMGHVNNAAYLDWVEEGLLASASSPGSDQGLALPVGLDEPSPDGGDGQGLGVGAGSGGAAAALPRRARLEYLASAAPGDEIVVTTWMAGSSWTSRIARADGTELLRGVGVLGSDAASALGSIEGVPALA
jgi:acyl-ACP thioesterase